MFDEILDYLLQQDTSGYPNPENFEYNGYTLEAMVDDALYDLLRNAEGPYIHYFLVDLINTLEMGMTLWSEIIKEMEEFEE